MKNTLILSVICAAALSACGGGEDGSRTTGLRACVELSAAAPSQECKPTKMAAAPDARRTALAAVPSGLTASEVMNWAENTYPDLFPGNQPNNDYAQFSYRYYATTNNYLGIAGDGVWLMGNLVNSPDTPVFYSDVSAFSAVVRTGNNPQGIYVSIYNLTLIEADGTAWIMDTTPGEAVMSLGKVAMANGREITARQESLSYHHNTIALKGSYEPKLTFDFRLEGLVNGKTHDHTTWYDPAYDRAMALPVGTFNTSDFHSVLPTRFVIAANGAFTGTSGSTEPATSCSFAGQFNPTGKGYQKVEISFGNNCAVPNGTRGTGVLIRYVDGTFLFATNQMGLYGEQSFVAFITTPAAAKPAALLANRPV